MIPSQDVRSLASLYNTRVLIKENTFPGKQKPIVTPGDTSSWTKAKETSQEQEIKRKERNTSKWAKRKERWDNWKTQKKAEDAEEPEKDTYKAPDESISVKLTVSEIVAIMDALDEKAQQDGLNETLYTCLKSAYDKFEAATGSKMDADDEYENTDPNFNRSASISDEPSVPNPYGDTEERGHL